MTEDCSKQDKNNYDAYNKYIGAEVIMYVQG